MGKGGDSTTTTSSDPLSEAATPYFKDAMEKAKTATSMPYQKYNNPRLADFSSDTNDSFGMIRRQARAGTPELNGAIRAARGIAGYRANPIRTAGVRTRDVRSQDVRAQNVANPGDFDFRGVPGMDMDAYMNPYVENVLDVQKQRLGQSFEEQQQGRNAQAVAAGAFGGDRRFVQDSLAQRDMNQQLQGIEAEGLASAFDSAMGMFQSDEGRRLAAHEGDRGRDVQVGISNADRQLAARTGNADRRLEAMTGNANRRIGVATGNADRRLQAAGMSEDARRLGAGLGLDAAKSWADFGQQRMDAGFRNAEALSGVGAKIQQRNQAGLDLAYKDFVQQRDYPQQQAALYAQLLSGTPVTPQTTQTTTEAPPDFLSQMMGLAVGGAGIWDLLN